MSSKLEFPQSTIDTVLIVEDEVLIRTAIAEYLRHCGYKVIETASADEALTVLTEPQIKVDIVFCDVQMPGSLDGFGLSKWVREHRRELPVILTGTVEKATEAAGDLCEKGPHLQKPYEPQQVLEWIKRLRASVVSDKSS